MTNAYQFSFCSPAPKLETSLSGAPIPECRGPKRRRRLRGGQVSAPTSSAEAAAGEAQQPDAHRDSFFTKRYAKRTRMQAGLVEYSPSAKRWRTIDATSSSSSSSGGGSDQTATDIFGPSTPPAQPNDIPAPNPPCASCAKREEPEQILEAATCNVTYLHQQMLTFKALSTQLRSENAKLEAQVRELHRKLEDRAVQTRKGRELTQRPAFESTPEVDIGKASRGEWERECQALLQQLQTKDVLIRKQAIYIKELLELRENMSKEMTQSRELSLEQ